VAEPDGGVLYADTSALVKLVVREAESDAIEAEVYRWGLIATSDIAAIELPRATARARADGRAGVADSRVVLEVLAAQHRADDRRRLCARGNARTSRVADA
jgi:predicted nucleic acid-binding protein